MPTESGKNKIVWIKAFINGIIAYILGFILYMIPALVIATKMAFELGPKSEDPAMVSEQISQTIPNIYQNNLLLTLGFIVVTALLIFWRARLVSKSTGDKKIPNGLLVAVFPVLFSVLFIFSTGFDFLSVIEILAFVVAGYIGGYFSK